MSTGKECRLEAAKEENSWCLEVNFVFGSGRFWSVFFCGVWVWEAEGFARVVLDVWIGGECVEGAVEVFDEEAQV